MIRVRYASIRKLASSNQRGYNFRRNLVSGSCVISKFAVQDTTLSQEPLPSLPPEPSVISLLISELKISWLMKCGTLRPDSEMASSRWLHSSLIFPWHSVPFSEAWMNVNFEFCPWQREVTTSYDLTESIGIRGDSFTFWGKMQWLNTNRAMTLSCRRRIDKTICAHLSSDEA